MYDSGSDAARLNAAPVGQPVYVARELIEVLGLYEQWRTRTGGAYTANVGGLVLLWREAEARGERPTNDAIAREVRAMQSAQVAIDADGGTVKRLADVQVNVDSLGKGYIVSKALAAAHEKVPGVRGMLLNIGGDIAAYGYSMVDRKVKWPVAVADPNRPAENAPPVVKLMLTDMAVATSGGYARGYEVGGERYSHILDPRTGKPVDAGGHAKKWAVESATVLAEDCATANALATTLCVLTPEEGLKLVKSVKGAECFLVLADGGHLRTESICGNRKGHTAR